MCHLWGGAKSFKPKQHGPLSQPCPKITLTHLSSLLLLENRFISLFTQSKVIQTVITNISGNWPALTMLLTKPILLFFFWEEYHRTWGVLNVYILARVLCWSHSFGIEEAGFCFLSDQLCFVNFFFLAWAIRMEMSIALKSLPVANYIGGKGNQRIKYLISSLLLNCNETWKISSSD